MSTDNEDAVAELKRLAEAATPGPWTTESPNYGDTSDTDARELYHWSVRCPSAPPAISHQLCRLSSINSNEQSDASYIAAANPSAILNLIAAHAAQAERIAELEAALQHESAAALAHERRHQELLHEKMQPVGQPVQQPGDVRDAVKPLHISEWASIRTAADAVESYGLPELAETLRAITLAHEPSYAVAALVASVLPSAATGSKTLERELKASRALCDEHFNTILELRAAADEHECGALVAPMQGGLTFEQWMEREYLDREDRQQKFRMSSVRELMRSAWDFASQSAAPVAASDAVDVQRASVPSTITFDQMVAIRAKITPGDGWDGDEWDFALAKAIVKTIARRFAASGSAQPADSYDAAAMDRQYLAGYDAGFMAGESGDDTKRAAVQASRSRSIREARPIQAATVTGAQAGAQPKQAPKPPKPLTTCAANRDGDCVHPACPQLRDNEPAATDRHCPLDN